MANKTHALMVRRLEALRREAAARVRVFTPEEVAAYAASQGLAASPMSADVVTERMAGARPNFAPYYKGPRR